jgi:hypothetical protein
MSQVTYQPGQTGRTPMRGGGPEWTGWVGFAGVMMILLGAFNLIDGLVALFKDEYFVVGKDRLLILDFTTWGWIWLILGIVVLLAGIAVMAGRTWGIVIGVIIAVLNAIGQLSFLSSFPIWSTLIIVLDITVIYALVAHGSERGAEAPGRQPG